MEINRDEVIEFLKESNAIEREYDADSLAQAIYAWEYIIEQEELTIQKILRTHKVLMLNQNLLPDEKGYFRKCGVWIGGRAGIHHLKIKDEMAHWLMNVMDVVNNGKNESDIFKEKICKQHHVEYEKIHPFVDGNGRTGRIFMNWERYQLGLPLLIIHEGEEQMDYYKWFK